MDHAFFCDTSNVFQVFQGFEWSVILAVIKDPRGQGGADAGEHLKLLFPRGVDIDLEMAHLLGPAHRGYIPAQQQLHRGPHDKNDHGQADELALLRC